MKKVYLFLALVLSAFIATAQAPVAFNYQAIARDADGIQLANKGISVRIGILQGSASGSEVFSETHSPTTNDFGLFNLMIGNGSNQSGDLMTIDWGNDAYYIKVEVDFEGGSSYTLMSTSQLTSVPYALFAQHVLNDSVDDADNDPDNERIVGLTFANDELTIDEAGTDYTVDLSGLADDGDWMRSDDTLYTTDDLVSIGGMADPAAKLTVSADSGTAVMIKRDSAITYSALMIQENDNQSTYSYGTNVTVNNPYIGYGAYNYVFNAVNTGYGALNRSGYSDDYGYGSFNSSYYSGGDGFGAYNQSYNDGGDGYGSYNYCYSPGASGYGSYNYVTYPATYGYGNYLEVYGSNAYTQYGIYNDVTQAGSGQAQGSYTYVDHNGSTGNAYGHNIRVDGNDNMYGVYVDLNGAGTNSGDYRYGMYMDVDNSNTGNYKYTYGLESNSNAYNGYDLDVYGVRGLAYSSNATYRHNYGIFGYASGGITANWAGYFNGSVYATGSYVSSDAKLKTNVRSYESALDDLMLLQPKRYDFLADDYPSMALPEEAQIGLIAQELEEVFPELVKQSMNPALEMTEEIAQQQGFEYTIIEPAQTDEDGNETSPARVRVGEDVEFKAVNYNGLIPVLIKAVQEQQAIIEAMEDRIEQLENQ